MNTINYGIIDMDTTCRIDSSRHWNRLNAFISGVFRGTEKIINSNPTVKNLTKDAKRFINNITSNYIDYYSI